MFAVCFHGFDAAVELPGDFGIALTGADEAQHFAFALAQWHQLGGQWGTRQAPLAAAQQAADGHQQHGGRDLLAEVTAGTGSVGVTRVQLAVVNAQHQHDQIRPAAFERGDQLQAGIVTQRNINDGEMMLTVLLRRQRGGCRAGFVANVQVGFAGEQRANAFADDGMVVGNQDTGQFSAHRWLPVSCWTAATVR